jgi:tRNA(Ile2)-agmatinylcytidine synthase
MWIGIDDTDSREGGCTTYIGFLLSGALQKYLTGFPRLVRLNPNIPYKTRGNGAVSLHFSKSAGDRIIIGKKDGEWIFSRRDNAAEEEYIPEAFTIAEKLVEDNMIKGNDQTNPGLIGGTRIPTESFYRMALEKIIDQKISYSLLEELGITHREWGNGRGITGSLASIAWRGRRITYELISYNSPNGKRLPARDKRIIGEMCESRQDTFNNMDSSGKIALFPKERTPVVYGIRSISHETLLSIQEEIGRLYPDLDRNFLIYQTNQGTDDHIIHDPEILEEGGSYSLKGRIDGVPVRGEGGHMSIPFRHEKGIMNLMAFEPSKSFRNLLQGLRPGDLVRVYGSLSRGNLKLEKINLMEISEIYRRVAPNCSACGGKTRNTGSGIYQCVSCHRKNMPAYRREQRTMVKGKYEPPAFARRHLSMPWKLESAFSA